MAYIDSLQARNSQIIIVAEVTRCSRVTQCNPTLNEWHLMVTIRNNVTWLPANGTPLRHSILASVFIDFLYLVCQ